jgi:hypothetical protein
LAIADVGRQWDTPALFEQIEPRDLRIGDKQDVAFGGMRNDDEVLSFSAFGISKNDLFTGLKITSGFGEEFGNAVFFSQEEAFPSS